jgi:hypothetical protein
MANKEGEDEVAAQALVVRATGVSLNHADVNGGVDYLAEDGVSLALEVTRITDGRRAGGRKALDGWAAESPKLNTCWVVTVADQGVKLKRLAHRLVEPISDFEATGRQRFTRQLAGIDVLTQSAEKEVLIPLLNSGIEDAVFVEDPHRDHVHAVFVTLFGGGSSSGSDAALDEIEDELNSPARADNYKKLREAGAVQRHLFVWLDHDTDFAIARPLAKGGSEFPDRFGLPTRAPKLDDAVTHLWVVHEWSGQGWMWDGQQWMPVSAGPPESS